MITRSLATLVVAGALVAAPAAALATSTPYPAPESDLTCSTQQAAPNEDFECTVTGPDSATAQLQTDFDGEDALVEPVAGTVTSAGSTITSGTADFTVTAPSIEGTIQIIAFVDGVEVDATAAVLVTDELSGTGFDGMPLAIAAGALLAGGAVVILVAARRRSRENVEN